MSRAVYCTVNYSVKPEGVTRSFLSPYQLYDTSRKLCPSATRMDAAEDKKITNFDEFPWFNIAWKYFIAWKDTVFDHLCYRRKQQQGLRYLGGSCLRSTTSLFMGAAVISSFFGFIIRPRLCAHEFILFFFYVFFPLSHSFFCHSIFPFFSIVMSLVPSYFSLLLLLIITDYYRLQ
jgi:hypothetical protein